MDGALWIVLVVAIGCTYELGKRIVERVFVPRSEPGLKEEIAALREEVRQLRKESHDIFLALDDDHSLRRQSLSRPEAASVEQVSGR